MISMTSPNKITNQTAKVRANASHLAKQIGRIVIDKPSNPVRIGFTGDGMSIWTHDLSKTVQVYLSDSEINGLTVKDDCVIMVDPSSFVDLLTTKYGSQPIQISTKAGEVINIKDQDGSQAVFHPADEDDCVSIPDRWFLPSDNDGWVLLPMKDNERCTTRIKITRSNLQKGLIDMKVANAPYVVFTFSDKGSSCASGHWGAKTNQSRSRIDADVEGEDVEVVFTDTLNTILSKSDGDVFIIQKHKDVGFAVVDCGDIRFVATEAQREV